MIYDKVFDALRKTLNFSVLLSNPSDEEWGVRRWDDDRGTWHWTGMVGQLLREEADVSIAGLTITSERQEAIDFTVGIVPVG